MSPTRTEIIDALPFDAYRTAPGVHKSFLDQFARCPAAAYAYMVTGGERPSKAMIRGAAVDCLLCEPKQFRSRFHIRPETYEADRGERKAWNGNAKKCREWIDAHRDRPILTAVDVMEAEILADAVRSEPKAAALLRGCSVQQSVFWSDPRTGLQLKGRPDFVGPDYAIDLKVIRDASDRAISRAIAEYRYYVQAAMYMDGLVANGRRCKAFYFIFVEPGDGPLVNVRRLKSEAIDLGRMVYNEQLLKVRDCFESNVWPGFSGEGKDVLDVDLPAYTYNSNGDCLTLTIGGQDMEF